ncbi:PepSY-associated transmembrane protein [Lutibacter oceani]|uniref:PepSY-associated transmembrane protein n=1 Tax=Lutibacter oceani TaxID=1853311 RepID=A0A3D9S1G3_9FLAO|nr:PepSY-associated TM helix domain-containing protein [Lutibacter oceani]REE83694.1 PepSY-associated transmembrane protein [Lutibacter oceani]
MNSRQTQAKILRIFRKIHRTTGAMLFIFFFFIAVTGILLGWKNNSNELIIPKNQQGTSVELSEWLPIDSLHKNACKILQDSIAPNISLELDRIDIRKNKGIVKFVFEKHNWEVQLDGATGDLLNLGKRYSDFIEDLHDGTILDTWFNTSTKPFKLIYTSIMGIALLLFTITGFWLWYGPKRLKKQRKRNT